MERKLLLLILYILIACIAVTNVVKAQETILKVYPESMQVEAPGVTFDINITITEVTKLWSWALNVSWDPAVLNCTGCEEGPFMKEVLSTFFAAASPNNTSGEIPEISCTSMATSAPFSASGDGTIMTLTFLSIAEGESGIILGGGYPGHWGPDFMNEDYERIPLIVQNGTVTVIPEFPASMILPLFMITTITIAIIAKVMQSKRRRGHINVR